MKKLVSFMLVSVMVASSFAVQAELRIAVVSFPRLLSEAPQAKSATQSIQNEYEAKRSQLQSKQQELIDLQKQVTRDFETMSEEQKRSKSEEFRSKQREFMEKEKQLLTEFNQKRNEKLGELQKTLMTQVNTLAQELGYDLILGEGVLYASPSIDVTEQVLARLR